jgi:hypothetical protein
MDIKPTKPNTVSKVWQDIGYYKDERGYLKYGVIPNKQLI